VLQEILHRYTAIDRREAIRPAFQVMLTMIDEVFPVERADVLRAGEICQDRAWSARDAVHIAVMERRGIQSILILTRISTAARAESNPSGPRIGGGHEKKIESSSGGFPHEQTLALRDGRRLLHSGDRRYRS
jgi:hypothetical protein